MIKPRLQERRLLLAKNSIMLLVTAITISLAVWAWFSAADQPAVATGLQVSTRADGLEFARPLENGGFPVAQEAYSSTLNFEDYEDISRILTLDVTSDGKNFISPTTKTVSGLRTVEKDKEWTLAKANEDYMSVDFYARSTSNCVYLKSDSFLKAAVEKLTQRYPDAEGGLGRLDTTKIDETRKSVYGNFTVDALVGAIRVSIVGGNVQSQSDEGVISYGTQSKLRTLWIPRPDIYLDASDKQSSWELFKGVLPDSVMEKESPTGAKVPAGTTYKHNCYYPATESQLLSKKGTGVTRKTVDEAVASVVSADDEGYPNYTPTLGQDVQLADSELTNLGMVSMEDGDFYLYKFTLNIWIEGEDEEARRAMNGGEFNLFLDFGINSNKVADGTP